MNDDIKAVQSDVDRYGALSALSTSEGGQVLVKTLAQDAMSAIANLAGQYKTLPDTEMRALCARLSVTLSLYRALTNAQTNLDGAKDELQKLTEDSQ